MNKLFGFLAGAMCGAVVGATAVLLTTPVAGDELRSGAVSRWELAIAEGKKAMVETKQRMEGEFETMKGSG